MPKVPIYEDLKMVSIEMNTTITRKLKQIAKREEISFAQLCRRLFSDYVDKYERKNGKIKLPDME